MICASGGRRVEAAYAPRVKLTEIASCMDVTESLIAEAMAPARSMNDQSPREKCLALVRHMASVACPNQSAWRVLELLARMSKRSWLEGRLVVRLIGDSELTVLELLVDDGVAAERMLPPVRMDVPLAELAKYIDGHRRELAPLTYKEQPSDRRLVLWGMPEHQRQHRKPSFSALDTSLIAQAAGRRVEIEGGTPAVATAPAPERSSPSSDPPIAAYDRPSATLEIPDHLRDPAAPAQAPAKAKAKPPRPPPPRRKPR